MIVIVRYFFPLHARTKLRIEEFGLTKKYESIENVTLLEPLGYIDPLPTLMHVIL